ncbi:MAG: alkaline phosphatase family protein, partial [Acidobacteria bacterium]|nr:alkaline phosphatase family protein [Acidobacteriota bacterium]
PEKLAQLPDPEGFRRAIALWRAYTGRRELLPNLRRYFYEQGVRAVEMYSATVTLSSAAWSLIDTGQPTVIKKHMAFSRQNGYLRSHLDGLRDSFEFIFRDARKTNAQWNLDQAGVSLFSDAFNPLRVYVTPQLLHRQRGSEYINYLKGLTRHWASGGHPFSRPFEVVGHHFARRVKGMDYPDFTEDFMADHLAEMLLARDFSGQEQYDYLSTFFPIVDHQHHVDPNPENIVFRMLRLDRRVGRILAAVERSQRREETIVTLISDHGSEYQPGQINLSFPLTRVFRSPLFGGHTVATVMAENSARALTTLPGIDFPRVYESPFSPYGKARPGGEDDYVTAFIDNFGNARAEIHLRNNDLNRLHLLLLARASRRLSQDDRSRLRAHLAETLAALRAWLESERQAYHDYRTGVLAWLPQLEQRKDTYWSDAAARLRGEALRDAGQLRVLDLLWDLCQAEDPLAWLDQHRPKIPALIPKKYFGPRNSLYQLSHYTIGLTDDWNWIETTADHQGRTVPMNYFEILTGYRALNPPASGEPDPFDLIVAEVPVDAVARAGHEQGWWDAGTPLEQALWVLSSAEEERRGGQALLLEAEDGRLRYLPLRRLVPQPGGSVDVERSDACDPLGLLGDPEFRPPTGESAAAWLERFHSPEEWLEATARTRYSNAPVVLADIMRFNAARFIDNPAFQQRLTGFSSPEFKQRYLRGLRWKYASGQPELRVWSARLWNFSSKTYTSGGSHGGLVPQVSHVAFYLWGGARTGVQPGQVLHEPSTTLDIVPTLAAALGMLDDQGRVLPQPGAVRDRAFLPFPGRVLSLWAPEEAPAVANRRKLPALFDPCF